MKNNKDSKNISDNLIDITAETQRKNAQSTGPELNIFATEDEQINEYYVKLSYKIRFCKFLSLFLFVVFVLCMITAFSTDITAEKFRYLMKDMNIDLPVTQSEFGNIAYTEDAELSFAMFKNDLLSVGRQSVEIVDMAGNIVLNSEINYVKPNVAVGKNYFLVYDLAGYDFSVYNSFSSLYSETLDYPISNAYMCDNGRFAIVTRDAEYRCCVLIYNKKYELAYTWKTNDKYVFDVILNEDGTFIFYTASVTNGKFNTECIKGDIKNDTVTSTAYGKNILALDARTFADTNRSVFCTDRILFTNSANDVLAQYLFNTDECALNCASAKYSGIVLHSATLGKENVLKVFDSQGNNICTTDIPAHALSLYIHGEYAYLLYTGDILQISLNDGTQKHFKCENTVFALLETESGVLLAAGKNRAIPIQLESFK